MENITSMTNEQKMSIIIDIFRSFSKETKYSLEDFYKQFYDKLAEYEMSTEDFENITNQMINYFKKVKGEDIL